MTNFSRRTMLTVFVLMTSATALACNVPVFRYALEHWHPDRYRLEVVSGRPLTDEETRLVDDLETLSATGRLNLVLTQAPTSQTNAGTGNDDGPRMRIRFPETFASETFCWDVSLNSTAVQRLQNSPVRRQVVERLAQGQSAVWLLIDGEDSEENKRTEDFVQEQLRRLQGTLELPKLTDAPEDRIQSGPELRVEFSFIRIPRHDESESLLVQTLLSSEPDLLDLKKPCLFPVFGRGRAFLPLVGAGISEDNLRETASFVIGACSCQVKELNPGFDLLVEADWGVLLPWCSNPAGNSDSMGLVAAQSGRVAQEPILVPIAAGRSKLSPKTVASTGADTDARSGADLFLIITGAIVVIFTIILRVVRNERRSGPKA